MKTSIVASVDVQGRLFGRRSFVHDSNDHDEAACCVSALAWDFAQMPIDGVSFAGFDTGWQDLYLVKQGPPITLDWLPSTELYLADIALKPGRSDGGSQLLTSAPTSLLKQQVQSLSAAGLTSRMASELEFYGVDTTKVTTEQPRVDYGINSFTNSDDEFCQLIAEHLSKSGIVVIGRQAEWGPGQLEMNLSPETPEIAARNHVLFKLAVHDLARRTGRKVTFMAKPGDNLVGSSCHVHISLYDERKRNIFVDDCGAPSQACLHAIGGLLQCLPQFLLFYAPTINSYKRLNAREFSGCGATWGIDNRTVSCRVILSQPDNARLEFRIPGADVNPYLVYSAILASIQYGMANKLDPGRQVTGNGYERSLAKHLPRSLGEALEVAERGKMIAELLGEESRELYLAHARHEWKEFINAVTEWEVSRYSPIV